MCGLNIAHKLLPGKENKNCAAGDVAYILLQREFFSTVPPNILNAPPCDEAKCVFLSGTKALKKHSVTLILKCREGKKQFSVFFLRTLKSYAAFK